MPLAALPIALIASSAIGAGGAVAGGLIGSSAAKTAAQQQAQSAQNALNYTKEVEAPYLSAGNTSIAKLMESIQNGTFGPGSLPTFNAPTLEDVRNTPGYQFAQEQGQLGISRQQAAAGGAFTGGTVKAGEQFGTGLADSTYSNRFAEAMQTYQAQLSKQSQEYQQLLAPATIGANAASGTSTNVANLMTQQGNALASGTIGSANALAGGIGGATNAVTQGLQLSQLLNMNGINNPQNIQNSLNAGYSSIQSNGLPTGGTYEPPPVSAPAFPSTPG